MKTLEEIREICSKENSWGMSEENHKIFDKYSTMLFEAWEQWDDDVTREFWEGEEKPDDPTESFREDFYDNFCFEEEFPAELFGDEF